MYKSNNCKVDSNVQRTLRFPFATNSDSSIDIEKQNKAISSETLRKSCLRFNNTFNLISSWRLIRSQ